MIINYLKLAFRVLMKKKFFTFISLFGISITLMVLTLFISFTESQLGSNKPMTDKNKMIFINYLMLDRMVTDTIITIDTLYENDMTKFDTTYAYPENSISSSTASFSYHFLDTYMRDIDNVSQYSFHNTSHTFDVFVNNTKVTIQGIYSDAVYFDVFDFEFLEGNAWDKTALNNQEQVGVITDMAALKYFGTDEKIVGREILIEGKHFKISGMIKAPTITYDYIKADFYMPYTNLNALTFKKDNYRGSFLACFVANTVADIPLIQEQIEYKASNLTPLGEDWTFNKSEVQAKTFGEVYAQGIVFKQDARESKRYVVLIVGTLLGLFLLLPILNLIKINVSRIMDRSIEIGVRKAFGANRKDIMIQFIFENVILTLLGGFIGVLLTVVVVKILNDSKALTPIVLSVNYIVLFYSTLIALVFGVLSGLAPAMKMSKIHIVNALNKNNL